jgi:hypothetical protein
MKGSAWPGGAALLGARALRGGALVAVYPAHRGSVYAQNK